MLNKQKYHFIFLIQISWDKAESGTEFENERADGLPEGEWIHPDNMGISVFTIE